MRNPSQLSWRPLAIAALLVLGVATTVATSQARWTLTDNAMLSFEEDQTTRTVTITTSSKNNTSAVLLQGLIEAPTSDGIDAFTWELTLEGATPERKPIELVVVEFEEPHQHRGSAAWRGASKELPSCPESACTFTLTLERSGDDLDAIEVNLIASMSVTGEGDPPGGSSFEVKSE